MRSRFPLLLKKRGRRRTGSVAWTRAAEFAYQATFVVAGAIGAWWCLTDVLLPELKLAQEIKGFQRAKGTVVDTHVAVRPGLAEDEYCPELRIRFKTKTARTITAWTRHGVGRDTPSRQEAALALEPFQKGANLPCWYDPEDPQRVVLSTGSRWWPWFVLVIPVSLMASGLIGLWWAIARVQSSAERRASTAPSAVPLPNAEPIADSPGLRLAYRLPLDGGEGWRLSGMATLCVMWNLLAGLVVFQAIGFDSLPGRLGLTLLVVAPLAATSVWMIRSLWRDATSVGGFGATRAEIATHPLQPGQSVQGVVFQSGSGRIRLLTISLVCEEVATYEQGTDSRVATVEVVRETLVRERGLLVEPGQALELDFTITIPATGPLSFRSPHNEVRWSLETRLAPVRSAEATRRFPLCVYPPEPTLAPSADSVSLSSSGLSLEAVSR
ncbi:DUF3592 domain-containing protein [Botrimarina hoheduenensis]|uniref:DUF3592 domain-containing protein n=1 Tax=Botrimarina hoheduenensis TaxID=2528000 RepID=A0A5C5VNQ0_9BACT|nr:DUF3592 domain-containing protein [Botrimarina hoheduenensis]TWT40238.1 hypothetical protein Pla111_33700 [Botrimarina hoheduenensis]